MTPSGVMEPVILPRPRLSDWRLVAVAGLFPTVVGLANVLVAGSGALPVSGTDLPFCRMVTWMFGVNLAMTGAFIAAVSYFGLREGHRWAWRLLLGAILWVGVNDTFCLVRYRLETGSGYPVATIPTVLGLVGLARARRSIA